MAMIQTTKALKNLILISLISLAMIGCNRDSGGSGASTEQPGSSASSPAQVVPAAPVAPAPVPPAETGNASGTEPATPAGSTPGGGKEGGS
jgi:hypothetical protein